MHGVPSSLVRSQTDLEKKMDRALNRSLTQANSAAAVRYMVSVIGVGSFTKTG
jgi:hypothetical protein